MLACKIVCAPGLIVECSHLQVALQVPLAKVLCRNCIHVSGHLLSLPEHSGYATVCKQHM